MAPVSHIVEANEWTQRYQRNNKRSGLKNLRCFPACSDSHKFRGFCGRPVPVRVDRETPFSGAESYVWAEFQRSGSDSLVKLGSRTTLAECLAKERSKVDPFKPWMAGEPLGGNAARKLPSSVHVINKSKRGWHYSWVANKHTCDAEHILRVYVFQAIDAQTLECIDVVDSPNFTIFCRRRQRQNLDRLPPQLKIQLEMQAKEKERKLALMKQEASSTSSAAQRKKRASATSAKPSTTKRSRRAKKTEPRTGGGERFPDEEEMIGEISSFPSFDFTKRDDDEVSPPYATGLSITTGLIGLDSASDGASSADPSSPFDDIHTSYSARPSPRSPSGLTWAQLQQRGHATVKQEQGVGGRQQPHGMDGLHSVDHQQSSPTVCALTAVPAPPQTEEERKENDAMLWRVTIALLLYRGRSGEAQSGSQGGSCGTTPSGPVGGGEMSLDEFSRSISDCIDSFLPELDLPIETGMNIPGGFLRDDTSTLEILDFDVSCLDFKPSKDFVIDELAMFLIKERAFTDMIGKVFTQDPSQSYEERKRAFLDVLETNMNVFLLKFGMTLKELDQSIANSVKLNKPFTNMQMEKHISLYCCTSPREPELDSAIVRRFPMPDKTITDGVDFSGIWIREESSLNNLETLRASIGVPWVLRQIYKQMEARMVIRHVPGKMDVQQNRKLMSTGFMSYILDGKDHEWDMPPPVFTGRPVGVSYQAWIEDNKLWVVHNYSKKKRIIRTTTKSQDGTRLSSQIAYEQRDTNDGEWKQVGMTTAEARRSDEDPLNTTAKE